MSAEAVGLIALSFTLLIHLAGTIWWAAQLTSRVQHIEKWISSNEHTGERLAAVEEQLKSLAASISRVERLLMGGHG